MYPAKAEKAVELIGRISVTTPSTKDRALTILLGDSTDDRFQKRLEKLKESKKL